MASEPTISPRRDWTVYVLNVTKDETCGGMEDDELLAVTIAPPMVQVDAVPAAASAVDATGIAIA